MTKDEKEQIELEDRLERKHIGKLKKRILK